ncbi:hypothetical protein [Bacillus cereus]|uniref:hypothetical protein n=1 Tax=Bacillus cereus TaxID=1396 RepID=UPI0015D47A93|nr:hypothetical protein [Bacillus cereus]
MQSLVMVVVHYTSKGSVAKFLKVSLTFAKQSEENHKWAILKGNSSRKILFW